MTKSFFSYKFRIQLSTVHMHAHTVHMYTYTYSTCTHTVHIHIHIQYMYTHTVHIHIQYMYSYTYSIVHMAPLPGVQEVGAGRADGGKERALLLHFASILHVLEEAKVQLQLEGLTANVALCPHTLGQHCLRQVCTSRQGGTDIA